MFVYLLQCSDGATYVGATKNVDKRLRQHNGEISGGARATTSKISKGYIWTRVCYVSGFPDWNSCLQFEWRWKQLSRKMVGSLGPLERRFHALQELLLLEKSTSNALPYSFWHNRPTVHLETNLEAGSIYLQDDDGHY